MNLPLNVDTAALSQSEPDILYESEIYMYTYAYHYSIYSLLDSDSTAEPTIALKTGGSYLLIKNKGLHSRQQYMRLGMSEAEDVSIEIDQHSNDTERGTRPYMVETFLLSV
jgi:hypothetical protein